MRVAMARWMPVIFVMGVTTVVFTQADKGTDEQRLMQLERDWARAIVKQDAAFVERLYHPDYTFISPDGQLVTRREDIADIKSGAIKAESSAVADLKVRIYGGDTAVVTGRTTLKATYKGKDISGDYLFTDTLVKEKNEWRCVATQSTRIVKQP